MRNFHQKITDECDKITKKEGFAEMGAHRLYFCISVQSPQWAFLCRKTEHLFERVSRIEILFVTSRRIHKKYVSKVWFYGALSH